MNRQQRRAQQRSKKPFQVNVRLAADPKQKIITMFFSQYINNFSLAPDEARQHAQHILAMVDEIDPAEVNMTQKLDL